MFRGCRCRGGGGGAGGGGREVLRGGGGGGGLGSSLAGKRVQNLDPVASSNPMDTETNKRLIDYAACSG